MHGPAARAQRLVDGVAPVEDHGRTSVGPSALSRTSQPSAASSSRRRSASSQLAGLARGLALVEQRAHRVVRAGVARVGVEQVVERQNLEHLAQVLVAHLLALVGLPDPCPDLGERPRRVEVVGERVEEALAMLLEVGRRGPGDEPAAGLAQPLHAGLRLRHRLVGEAQRLAVVPGDEEQDHGVAAPALEDVAEQRDVADALGHLLLAHLEHPVVHPDRRELGAARHARLRGLVLVVREDQVVAAAVDVEPDAEQLLGHRRALDVPARAPAAPGRVPGGVLALLRGLPEREVHRVLLEVRALDALALVHRVERAVRELAVVLVAAHAEVDVAARRIGAAVVDQRLDQLDDRPDRRAGERLVVGPAEPQAVGVGEVRRGHLLGELRARDPQRPRGVVDLVVDVGDVRDQRDRVALVLEEALEQR